MRRRAKVDGNHRLIVEALRAAGWYVKDVSRAGDGFVDLVAARGGRLELIEIKNDSQPPNKRGLTLCEAAVHLDFANAGIEIRIISNIDEAIAL